MPPVGTEAEDPMCPEMGQHRSLRGCQALTVPEAEGTGDQNQDGSAQREGHLLQISGDACD